RKVPFVRITDFDLMEIPSKVTTPTARLFSIIRLFTISWKKSRLGVFSSAIRHSSANIILSFCVLGDHMAGPLDKLSILNCTADLSAIVPEYPPRAAISRTICPFAIPPIAGLQDICPIVCIFIVTRSVLDPRFAAAAAASQPACPPPTTITSYVSVIIINFVVNVSRETYRKNRSAFILTQDKILPYYAFPPPLG